MGCIVSRKPETLGHVLLTSDGLSTAEAELAFMRCVMEHLGEDIDPDLAPPVYVPRPAWIQAAIKERLLPRMRRLKVCVLTDGATFVDQGFVAKLRADGPEGFFDVSLSRDATCCGGFEIPPENILAVTLADKPWLANKPEDELKPYRTAVQRAYDVYAKVGVLSPEGSQAPVGEHYETLLAGGMASSDALHQAQVGSALHAESTKLDTRYASEAEEWARELVSTHDVLIGNGGDPVTFNMIHQCSRRVSDALVSGVREGKIMYMGRSAGTMVACKSIEMSTFTRPQCLQHFAVHSVSRHHAATDLNNDGVSVTVLGALPLLRTALTVRPHFVCNQWAQAVLAKNLLAEREFEEEMASEMDDSQVANSSGSFEAAVQLANQVSTSATQDNPVYVPMFEGQALLCRITPTGEWFEAAGKHR